ncbi:conserved hypothetical protein [Altererythrobacter sp. B11]|uniref:hypothetical protein n=1 Tax=Altererythrobacter sp. B11 TaxID=2060312 RepID=UPI000DC703C6|nr:hypothetical protein [Altererythrobacter sp. B11]BBC74333.1 conserved hypothetical protein [Altererythrobacter sp. B11]
MEGRTPGVHTETDEVRAGSTPHVVRWILGISLLAVIVALSAVWIIGAATHEGPDEAAVTPTAQTSGAVNSDGGTVITEGMDEMDAPQPGATSDTPLQTIPNDTSD